MPPSQQRSGRLGRLDGLLLPRRFAAGFLCRVGLGGVAWQNDPEVASFALRRLHPDLAAVPLDDQPTDVEAQTRAGHLEVLLAAHALELVKQPADLVLGDSKALVLDLDDDLLPAQPTANRDGSPVRRVLDCVRDEVREHLPEPVRVGDDDREVARYVDEDRVLGEPERDGIEGERAEVEAAKPDIGLYCAVNPFAGYCRASVRSENSGLNGRHAIPSTSRTGAGSSVRSMFIRARLAAL